MKYSDTDNNGFIDQIEYDMDGDHQFEEIINLNELEIDDQCELYDPETFQYKDYLQLKEKLAKNMWTQAMNAVIIAEHLGLNTNWFAKLKQAHSVRDHYHNGYWLQYYVFKDIQDFCFRKNDKELLKKVTIAYMTSDWKSILK